MGDSSKFPKSCTSEIQIFKPAGCLQKRIISCLNGQLCLDNLKNNQRIKLLLSTIISLIHHFESDFLWKVSLKILNSGLILRRLRHTYFLVCCILYDCRVYMDIVATEPIFKVSDQVRLKPVCSSSHTS